VQVPAIEANATPSRWLGSDDHGWNVAGQVFHGSQSPACLAGTSFRSLGTFWTICRLRSGCQPRSNQCRLRPIWNGGPRDYL